MTCTCAPACRALAASADGRWPGRSKASDGCCASQQHHAQNPSSDHEPNADGYATAYDLTHDLAHGVDTWSLADRLRLDCAPGREKRVKYIISNRRIASRKQGWIWRRYTGANAHAHHMHVSILQGYELSTAPWFDFDVPDVSEPRQPGVIVPLPPALVTAYPEDHMQRHDVRVGLDSDGNGYHDLPGVKAEDVVGMIVNAADPPTNGYPEHGVTVARLQVDGVTRVVAYDGPPSGAVDLDVWVATG